MPITFKSKHTFVLRKAQFLDTKIRRKFLLRGSTNRLASCAVSPGRTAVRCGCTGGFHSAPLCRPNGAPGGPQVKALLGGEVRTIRNRV